MAQYKITAPDGNNYMVTAPDGASQEDALAYAQQQISSGALKPTKTPGRNFTPNAGATWGAGDNFSSGVWQGLGDEIKAGAAAAKESLSGGLPFGKAYDQAKTAYQGARSDYTEENPKMGMATDIAGQVTPWMLGGGAVAASRAAPGAVGAASRALAPAATMPGRMAKGAAVGTGIGAASGFTNAEGDLTDRAKGAGIGAGIGAFTGGLAPPVIEGIAAVGKAGVQKILNGVAGGFTQAEQKLANAIAEMGGGDLKAGIAMVKSALSAGDDMALVDTIGIRGQKLGRAAANVQGESAQMADDFVGQRMAGRGERLQSAADNLAPRANIQNIADDLVKKRTLDSRPIYERTVNPDNQIDPAAFSAIERDPFMQKIIAKVQADELTGMNGLSSNSMPVVDAVKKELDDMISAAQRSGENNRARLLIGKRDELVTMADDAFPDYAGAREAWATPTRMKDALESGTKFIRSEADLTAKEIAAMSPQEQEMFRLGARKAISNLISTDTQTAVNKFADKKELLWSKLRAAFPDEPSFNAFKADIEKEMGRFKTEQFVSPRAGSQTAGLKEDIAELGRTPGVAMDVVGNLSTGNKIGALGAMLKGPVQKFMAPNQKTANALANALFELDPARQQQMLNSLSSKRVAEDVMPYLSVEKRKIMAQLLGRTGAAGGASQAGQ